MEASVEALGGLRVYRDGEELIDLLGRRVQCALLVYLAIERQASRDQLMALLWPDKDGERARKSLNNTAYELRNGLGTEWAVQRGDLLSVSPNVSTDVGRLVDVVAEGRYGEAGALVSGDFLEGSHLAPSHAFEQWVDAQRTRVRQLQRTARRGAVEEHRSRGMIGEALRQAEEWTRAMPLDEEAQYWHIRLLAEGGHRAAALGRFEQFTASLREELDVDPEPRIQELVTAIRRGEIEAARQPDPPTPPPRPVRRAGEGRPRRDRRGGATEEAPGRVGRLVKALGLYAVVATGLLQILDYLINYLRLPESFFPAALVLSLCGVPIVVATVFVEDRRSRGLTETGLKALAARWFTWKNATLGGIAGLSAWATAVAGWLLVGPGALERSLDPNRIVVFPLATTSAVQEPDAGWDAALAIGAALEHTEPLKFEDGWRELPPELRADPSALTPATARELSRARRAGRYIDGAIRDTGDRYSITLYLRDVAGDSLVTQETVEGLKSQTMLPELALASVTGLLPRLVQPGSDVDISAFSDRAPASIALWLQGEKAYRRSRFAEAFRFYQRAVEIDPTNAFAAVKGAQAGSWAFDDDTPEAELADALITRAAQNDSLLPDKYRHYLRGIEAQFHGDADEAVRAFNQALAIDPDWSEAAMAMGETYYHFLPTGAGAPDEVAGPWYDLAWELDPSFSPPLPHIAEIRLRAGQPDSARYYMDLLRGFEPDSVKLRHVELAADCLAEDGYDWDRHVDREIRFVVEAGLALAAGGWAPGCARGALTATFDSDAERSIRWTALKGLAGLALAAREYERADSLYRVGLRTDISAARTLYVYATLGGAPFEPQSAETERLLREAFGDLYEGAYTRWRWLAGVWLARTGELERLAALISDMESDAEAADDREGRMLSTSLRAHLAVARGDSTRAREILEALRPTGSSALLRFRESEALAPERLLLAELLLAEGKPLAAFEQAEALDHRAPVIFNHFLDASLRLRLRAARQASRPDLVERIEARLAALAGPDSAQ